MAGAIEIPCYLSSYEFEYKNKERNLSKDTWQRSQSTDHKVHGGPSPVSLATILDKSRDVALNFSWTNSTSISVPRFFVHGIYYPMVDQYREVHCNNLLTFSRRTKRSPFLPIIRSMDPSPCRFTIPVISRGDCCRDVPWFSRFVKSRDVRLFPGRTDDIERFDQSILLTSRHRPRDGNCSYPPQFLRDFCYLFFSVSFYFFTFLSVTKLMTNRYRNVPSIRNCKVNS